MLQLDGVSKTFDLPGGRQVRAVHDVSLDLRPGEIVGVLGESGSGKSTLSRLMIRAETVSAGRVVFDGHDVTSASASALKRIGMRRRVQIVFQDPYASFDPTVSVRASMRSAVRWMIGRRPDADDRIDRAVAEVGINPDWLERRPKQFSGGQLQRLSIARALLGEPEFLIADEAVSALDASVRADIVDLIFRLRESQGLGILFVSHDIRLVCSISDRVAVMYAGEKVEEALPDDLLHRSRHPYTQRLLANMPSLDVEALTAARQREGAADA